jgi:hypothetical protein
MAELLALEWFAVEQAEATALVLDPRAIADQHDASPALRPVMGANRASVGAADRCRLDPEIHRPVTTIPIPEQQARLHGRSVAQSPPRYSCIGALR